MSIWISYCEKLNKEKLPNQYNNESEFNRAYGIETEKEIPVFIARKSASAKEIKPTLKEYVIIEKKPRAVKLPKTKKPQVILTEEERKSNRTKWMREHREEWKKQGLTSKGKPFKQKEDKPEPTTDEIRAKRAEYAKTYRTKNREKHLQYRRDYRNGKVNVCNEITIKS